MPGGRYGAKADPLATLDRAMDETLAGLDEAGSGVEVADVIGSTPGAAAPPRTAPRARPRASEDLEPQPRRSPDRNTIAAPGRDARGRFLPTGGDADDGDDEVLVDDPTEVLADEQPRQTRARSRQVAPEDDLDELLADYDDGDDEQDEQRGYADAVMASAEEVEDDDDRLGPESASQQSAEEGTQQRQSQQPRLDKRTQRLVDQAVEARVGQVLTERDQLRAREQQQGQALAANQTFFRSVLGTDQQLAELHAQAINTALPLADRNYAAQLYQRYHENRQFAGQYQQGLMYIIQSQQADEDRKAMTSMARLKGLDTAIVNEGNRAKTLVHAYRVGMEAAEKSLRAKYLDRFRKLERENETLRGRLDEGSVRGGLTSGRGRGLAQASGRRNNGRVARPDPMRGAMSYQRGVDPTTRVPFPTDDLLKRIKNGELTLADIGLRAG